MTATAMSNDEACARACEALKPLRRVAITSHVRPDGDAIGSEIALAAALEGLGKTVRVVNADRTPPPFDEMPGVGRIEVADRIGDFGEAVVVLECGDLGRTGLVDLRGRVVINIDHHLGNTEYGTVNWFDVSSAACGEMVFDVIEGLGARLTPEIASHLYMAILTDTGSFRYSALSRRTYEIAGRLVEAGADPVSLGRLAFDSNSLGRLRLFGVVMAAMEVDAAGRIATLHLDHATAAASGASYEDTDGLINLPLTVKAIQAVAFFKQGEPGQYRVSLRSKGDIDVGSVARQFGGGGHKNAAGCSVAASLDDARASILGLVRAAVDAGLSAAAAPPPPPTIGS
jgi:phosphoesterase RecJ-like protein